MVEKKIEINLFWSKVCVKIFSTKFEETLLSTFVTGQKVHGPRKMSLTRLQFTEKAYSKNNNNNGIEIQRIFTEFNKRTLILNL